MIGRKRSHSCKASGCLHLHGKADRWLQEMWRKRRQHQSGDTISCIVVMAIADVVDGVEPMEVNPPKDQEKLLEVDSPPAQLIWYHCMVPGLPSITPQQWYHRKAQPPCLAIPTTWHLCDSCCPSEDLQGPWGLEVGFLQSEDEKAA